MASQRVLIPVALPGEADVGIEFGKQIADGLGADMVLFHVVGEAERADQSDWTPEMDQHDSATTAAVHDATEALKQVAEQMQFRSALVEVIASSAGPVPELLDRTSQGDVQVVVMQTSAPSVLVRAVRGSVTDEVATNISVPLILVNKEEPVPQTASELPDGIIVLLDGQLESEHVVPMATDMALAFKSKLFFIHVYSRDASTVETVAEDALEGSPADPSVADMETYLERFVSEAKSQGIDARAEVRRSTSLIESVEEVASSVTNPLVMVDATTKSGLTRLLTGSVPDDLNRNTSAPVMIVPGPGEAFNSPDPITHSVVPES